MKRVVGLLVVSFELLFYNARDEIDLSPLLNRDILTPAEKTYFGSLTKATPLHSVVRLLDYIHEASRKGLIGKEYGKSESMMLLLHTCLFTVRSGTSNVLMYIDVQMPYPFIQIISAVVYAFLIQLFFVCSAFVSQGIATGKVADIVRYRI
jgi:hypothetical protein